MMQLLFGKAFVVQNQFAACRCLALTFDDTDFDAMRCEGKFQRVRG